MKMIVWLLTTLGFITPLSLLVVRQMYTQQMLDDTMSIVTNAIPTVYTPWYVVISSLIFGLVAGTRRGRRTSGKLSRGVLSLAWHFLYLNTRVRLGRFMAFLWCCGWLGIALTGWQALWGSWLGLVMMVGYWGMMGCAYYLHERYQKWESLRYRLPGRLPWSGIGEQLRDAGGRWGSYFQNRGRSRR